MAERESFFWRWIWDAPLLGENVIQPVVLLFPGLCIILAGGFQEDTGAANLFLAIVEIGWLWGLEKFARMRLVVPIIPIPWMWVFSAAAGYALLGLFGIAGRG